MKHISKYKIENSVLIPIILLFIISIISIYATKDVLSTQYKYLWIKQILWYGIGIFLSFIIMTVGNKFLYNNAYILYIIGVISLILVLFFGVNINNARCWFKIPFIGTIQPSEFMKVFLIITLSRMINDFNEKYRYKNSITELKFLIKVLIIVFIPSILTFIEPDTGAVIMYLIITMSMLFIGGLRKRWFTLTISIILIFLISFFCIYYFNQDLFIKIFGPSFFYRIDRVINWRTSTGLQLNNSKIAVGSSGLSGHGFNKTPIYFPEMQTDFIFSVFASNYGFIGSIILIFIIIYFDENLIITVNKTNNEIDKYAIGGIVAVLLFQQLYNISMTIGLLPIMGITLPFISYGGSSLLSYMILLGIIFNVSNESLRYTN